jgi:hypothetical protein
MEGLRPGAVAFWKWPVRDEGTDLGAGAIRARGRAQRMSNSRQLRWTGARTIQIWVAHRWEVH